MSVDDVARVTKIQPRILERLEAGSFDGLPADVFVRGFVKSVARCVGLDEEEALRRYGMCGSTSATTSPTIAARAFVESMGDLAPQSSRPQARLARPEASSPRILIPPPQDVEISSEEIPALLPMASQEIPAVRDVEAIPELAPIDLVSVHAVPTTIAIAETMTGSVSVAAGDTADASASMSMSMSSMTELDCDASGSMPAMSSEAIATEMSSPSISLSELAASVDDKPKKKRVRKPSAKKRVAAGTPSDPASCVAASEGVVIDTASVDVATVDAASADATATVDATATADAIASVGAPAGVAAPAGDATAGVDAASAASTVTAEAAPKKRTRRRAAKGSLAPIATGTGVAQVIETNAAATNAAATNAAATNGASTNAAATNAAATNAAATNAASTNVAATNAAATNAAATNAAATNAAATNAASTSAAATNAASTNGVATSAAANEINVGSHVDSDVGGHIDSHVDSVAAAHVDSVGTHVDSVAAAQGDSAIGAQIDAAIGARIDAAIGARIDSATGGQVDSADGARVDSADAANDIFAAGDANDAIPVLTDAAAETAAIDSAAAAASAATAADDAMAVAWTPRWSPKMPPPSSSPSAPWRRPSVTTTPAPSLVIDDSDPDSAERVLEERTAARANTRRSFLPPILLDREDRSTRQGGLTLAVIILLIAATLTLSYLMRRPSSNGTGMTQLETPTQLAPVDLVG